MVNRIKSESVYTTLRFDNLFVVLLIHLPFYYFLSYNMLNHQQNKGWRNHIVGLLVDIIIPQPLLLGPPLNWDASVIGLFCGCVWPHPLSAIQNIRDKNR